MRGRVEFHRKLQRHGAVQILADIHGPHNGVQAPLIPIRRFTSSAAVPGVADAEHAADTAAAECDETGDDDDAGGADDTAADGERGAGRACGGSGDSGCCGHCGGPRTVVGGAVVDGSE